MKHIIGEYNEFIPNKGFGRMVDSFQKNTYNNQKLIVNYLNQGKTICVQAGKVVDIITGKKTTLTGKVQTDGKYMWFNEIAYYIEKYNLRLPEDIEEYILGKTDEKSQSN